MRYRDETKKSNTIRELKMEQKG